ncbi:MAG: transglycosylase SLT domain-containing protein [Mariprofundaceae bacterium]|nr:transglycosylase SLT domain-containing protein [Mariprofundaceae bacterium]
MWQGCNAYLRGASAKGILTMVLLLGFLFTLPFWMQSTPEEQQYLRQSTTAKIIQDQAMVLPAMPKNEQSVLRNMLKAPSSAQDNLDYDQIVWETDIRGLISRWVANDDEAKEIAHWTYHYSQRFNLSIELVLGVMSIESNFDHFAVSNVGARGLMQVMPFWKDKLGSPHDNLFVIETNIRYGCAVLRFYLDRYHTRARALQAYNGSLGRSKYSDKIITRMRMFKAIE